MLNGKYENPTIYYFGTDTEKFIAEELKGKYNNILLHFGKESFKSSELYPKIVEILNNAGIKYTELGGVESNPKADLVYKGIEICKSKDIDFILAVGGGSVIDSAKAIALGSLFDGDFWDIYLNKIPCPNKILPFATVLTNCGSGSETSTTSVITKENSKIPFYNPILRSKFSIMNPQNTVTVPIYPTLCGIFDSITHVFERYFSNTEYVDCSDRLCEGLILTLMKYAKLIKNEPKNYDYRAEIMWACKMATDPIISFGRKEDWSSHIIAHFIGGLTNRSHGEILSIIYPAWLEYCAGANEKLMKQFSKRIFNTEDIDVAIKSLRYFIQEIGLPLKLSEIGFDKKYFDYIANECAKINPSSTIGNFKRLDKKDIINILESVW